MTLVAGCFLHHYIALLFVEGGGGEYQTSSAAGF